MSANGSNPRLDRIEKILEELARTQRQDHAEHTRTFAEHTRTFAEHTRALQQSRAQHDQEMRIIRAEGRKTREDLRGWVALGVREARNQRKRQREIDLNITRLSAAQLVTEERLATLISSLAGGRNGGGRKSMSG